MADNEADGAEGAAAAAPKRAGKKNAVAPVDPMVRSFTLLNSSGATHTLSRSLRSGARDIPRVLDLVMICPEPLHARARLPLTTCARTAPASFTCLCVCALDRARAV